VRQNILYRLWPDKKAMFLAAIGHVFERSKAIWTERLASSEGGSAAERLLAYEARHLGEFGLYRILFAGLGESDDPEIRARLRETYRRFEQFIRRHVEEHRGARGGARLPDAELAAWALVGLGTIASLVRELDLLPAGKRARLLTEAGRALLGGRS
jgi:AcrR family transcriptional regulator